MWYPSCCIHTGRPPDGDVEVAQHLVTPTAKSLVGTWASAASTLQSTGPVNGLDPAAGGRLPLCTRARRLTCLHPKLVQQHQALSFLPHSHSRALPCFYHMQKSQNSLHPLRQAIGSGCLERRGPADATAAQAAHSGPRPAPLTLPASRAHEGLAAGKKKGLLSLIPQDL